MVCVVLSIGVREIATSRFVSLRMWCNWLLSVRLLPLTLVMRRVMSVRADG